MLGVLIWFLSGMLIKRRARITQQFGIILVTILSIVILTILLSSWRIPSSEPCTRTHPGVVQRSSWEVSGVGFRLRVEGLGFRAYRV